jgi:hypothetical protein
MGLRTLARAVALVVVLAVAPLAGGAPAAASVGTLAAARLGVDVLLAHRVRDQVRLRSVDIRVVARVRGSVMAPQR